MSSPEVELLVAAIAAMFSPTTLTFSVLALVLGEQPRRTGALFYIGALGATLAIGVLAGIALGDAAAAPAKSQPKTWVSVVDIVFGVAALLYAARLASRQLEPAKEEEMVGRMSALASSPWIAVVGAGAALANAGGFIPVALKDISQLNPSAGEFALYWVAFAVIALLPLGVALVMLTFAREPTMRVLTAARIWLTRNVMRIAAVLVAILGIVLIRDGIVGLTG
jgi:uncharacterized membrane protein